MSLVTANGVTVKLGGHTALNSVDFSISKGEIATVVGPNGSGKPTLLRAIICSVAPTLGKVSHTPGLKIG